MQVKIEGTSVKAETIDDLTNKYRKLAIKCKNKKPQRPTFYTHGGKPIRAGGVLFTHPDLGYLMQKKIIQKANKDPRPEFSDFGGKTDKVDTDIVDTIVRELAEETNNKLTLTRAELESGKARYFSDSKYILFIVAAPNSYSKEISEMGDRESHDGYLRTVEWVKPTLNCVHRRLRCFFKKVL
jgi:hypothetical protein